MASQQPFYGRLVRKRAQLFCQHIPAGDTSCGETFVACLQYLKTPSNVFWGRLNGLLIEDKVVNKKHIMLFLWN